MTTLPVIVAAAVPLTCSVIVAVIELNRADRCDAVRTACAGFAFAAAFGALDLGATIAATIATTATRPMTARVPATRPDRRCQPVAACCHASGETDRKSVV